VTRRARAAATVVSTRPGVTPGHRCRREEIFVSEATSEAHGPVDYLLIEFPTEKLTGAVAPRLVDLVESGTIRLYDLMVISKSESGAVEAVELRDSPVAQDFQYFAGASSGMLDDEDMRQAADAMAPGTVAALLVYENSWAAPFVAAAQSSGGEVIASGRIPATVVMEVLDALETADSGT
jgi:hypothetical protein